MKPANDIAIATAAANAAVTGKTQWTFGVVRVTFQAVFSNTTAAGTLQVQGSNDYATGLPPGQFIPTNWSSVGSPITVSSSATVYMTPEIETCYEYMRLIYTDTGGGTSTATVTARMKNFAF